jgi:cysteine synthase B
MILGAEERGELKPGVTMIEPTSGNTGIALAMVAAARGYPIELVMPANSTAERVYAMRAYGAKVSLTPESRGMEGTIDYAREKVARGGYLMLDQFSNPDNWRSHYVSTGPEIWRDTQQEITHFVSAMGTTGTIMGVSQYLKERNPSIQVVGCEPSEGSQIPGIRKWPQAYVPRICDWKRIDRMIEVTQHDAEEMTRRLAREEGIFAGISSGGALWSALEVSRQAENAVIVFIVCDRGDRYLSTGVFPA